MRGRSRRAWDRHSIGNPFLDAISRGTHRRTCVRRRWGEESLERIQREHLTYLDSLRVAGLIVTDGPVLDQPHESLRGLTFFRTGSLGEARRLAGQDPAVLERWSNLAVLFRYQMAELTRA